VKKKVNVFLDEVSFGCGLVCGACFIQKNDPSGAVMLVGLLKFLPRGRHTVKSLGSLALSFLLWH